jgi:hypothetical protein
MTDSRKGDVVSLRAARADRDPFELIGLPCTLVVERSERRVEW